MIRDDEISIEVDCFLHNVFGQIVGDQGVRDWFWLGWFYEQSHIVPRGCELFGCVRSKGVQNLLQREPICR